MINTIRINKILVTLNQIQLFSLKQPEYKIVFLWLYHSMVYKCINKFIIILFFVKKSTFIYHLKVKYNSDNIPIQKKISLMRRITIS